MEFIGLDLVIKLLVDLRSFSVVRVVYRKAFDILLMETHSEIDVKTEKSFWVLLDQGGLFEDFSRLMLNLLGQ